MGGSESTSIRLVGSGILVGEETGAGSPPIRGRERISPPAGPGNDWVEEGALGPSTVSMSISDEELGLGAIFLGFLGTG